MRLRAQLANVKIIDAGRGCLVRAHLARGGPTTLGLVPLGYGDGIPRHAGNTAEVAWRDGRAAVRGRICMDQFMIELGDADTRAEVGQEVTLFGRR